VLELRNVFEAKGFKCVEIPESNYLDCVLPWRGKITIFVGLLKCYPALDKEFKRRNLWAKLKDLPMFPFIEFLDGKDYHVRLPISNEAAFAIHSQKEVAKEEKSMKGKKEKAE